MAEKAAELITREEKIAQAKELYTRGSRNYLLKLYEEAADDLSQVCGLYSELYGELSSELGMPYLLYAKSLISLALEENNVVDVPYEENEEDDDDEDDDKEECENLMKKSEKATKNSENNEENTTKNYEKQEEQTVAEDLSKTNVKKDDAQPSTSNGTVDGNVEDIGQENNKEADEAATNLQVAWEILELAAKVFKNQGESALPNLAEVYTELANIEFENNIMESAREDYNKALEIYKNLSSNYRRPMAEIHYKIGLSYLMKQATKESAESLKLACQYLDEEINELKEKENPSDKDKINLQDMEETKQEIWVKIKEIEESLKECNAKIKEIIKNLMNPDPNSKSESGETSSSGASSSIEKPKPTDISHLVKRKKPDSCSADEEMSPAKRPAL